MTLNPEALLVIVLMAVITYALRAGGFWLMGRITISPRMEAALAYLPGSVITALVVPSTIQAGLPGVGAVAVIALVMWKRPGLLLALLLGLGTVVLVRNIL
jgi:uncharacterized membrane protein